MRRRFLGLGLVIVGLLGASCSGPAPSSPEPSTRTAPTESASVVQTPDGTITASPGPAGADLHAMDLVTGLQAPWGIVPQDDGSMLVSERDTARILRVGTATETLTTLTDVRPAGEGGLLGIALTPDASRLLAYITTQRDNRIVAMSWNGTRLGAPEPIFTGIPKGTIHNGGRMAIGPDGYLYVGTGETGDPRLAQDRDSLGGKILRLTLDGRPAPGNPFGNAVWSYGHRNVQGLAFDADGRLWASEFGQNAWDELNLITKGGNYGWPEVEGSGNEAGMINPAVVWTTDEASPSGLAYWRGELWMASLRGARLWEIPLDGDHAGGPIEHLTGDYGRLRTVVPTADGTALLVSTNNTDGRGSVRPGDDRILRVTRAGG